MQKELNRYVKSTYTQAWVAELEYLLKEKFLMPPKWKPSLRTLALLYSANDLYIEDGNGAPEDDLTANKPCWSKLRSGKRTVRDNALTFRAEKDFPSLQRIRKSFIWLILRKPLANKRECMDIVDLLRPNLEGKLFKTDTSALRISYQRNFYFPGKIELVDDMEALCLKLVVYRLKQLGVAGSEWPFDNTNITLHLLRILGHRPWSHAAHHLIQLLGVFFRVNDQPLMIGHEPIDLLKNELGDRVYWAIFAELLGSSSDWLSNHPTLQSYLIANYQLQQSFWDKFLPDCRHLWGSAFDRSEPLYWVDKNPECWLQSCQPKSKLFDYDVTVFEACRIRLARKHQKQIW